MNLHLIYSLNYIFPKSISDDDIALFLSVIVHEATYGYLFSKGFQYTNDKREQIERICVSEENRFLKNAASKHPEIASKYMREFNPEGWTYSWKTFVDMIKRVNAG